MKVSQICKIAKESVWKIYLLREFKRMSGLESRILLTAKLPCTTTACPKWQFVRNVASRQAGVLGGRVLGRKGGKIDR